MSSYQVHPDEMSAWCRDNLCGTCEDDLCEHDCHYEGDGSELPKWRQILRRNVVTAGLALGIFLVLDWLLPEGKLWIYPVFFMGGWVAVSLAKLIDPMEED